eukprot:GEMP01000892.1.p1 GENE.GEMP01000892.1~~GEMP01000892.1.p1  ORF type:complete len:1434 (+),score=314.01 GEMP01000892.1:73-4374(+)
MDPLDLNSGNRLGQASSPPHVPNPRLSNVPSIYTSMSGHASAMNARSKDARLPNSAVFLSNFGKAIRESSVLPPSRESIPTTQPLPPLSHTKGIRVRSNSEDTLPDTTTTISVPKGELPASGRDDLLSGNADSLGPTTTTIRRRLSEATLPDETPDVSALHENDAPQVNVSGDATQLFEMAEDDVSLGEMDKNDPPLVNVAGDDTLLVDTAEDDSPLVDNDEEDAPLVEKSVDDEPLVEKAEDDAPLVKKSVLRRQKGNPSASVDAETENHTEKKARTPRNAAANTGAVSSLNADVGNGLTASGGSTKKKAKTGAQKMAASSRESAQTLNGKLPASVDTDAGNGVEASGILELAQTNNGKPSASIDADVENGLAGSGGPAEKVGTPTQKGAASSREAAQTTNGKLPASADPDAGKDAVAAGKSSKRNAGTLVQKASASSPESAQTNNGNPSALVNSDVGDGATASGEPSKKKAKILARKTSANPGATNSPDADTGNSAITSNKQTKKNARVPAKNMATTTASSVDADTGNGAIASGESTKKNARIPAKKMTADATSLADADIGNSTTASDEPGKKKARIPAQKAVDNAETSNLLESTQPNNGELSCEPPKKKTKISAQKKTSAGTEPGSSPDAALRNNEKHLVTMDTNAQPVPVDTAEQQATNSDETPSPSGDNHVMVAVVEDEQRLQDKFWEWDPAAKKFTVHGEFAVLHATDGNPEFKIPVAVYQNLYDYQRVSLAWLAGLYLKRQGGILGDDMGMGKTVQVAAMLSGIWASKIGYHFMIAVPVTLIENWRVELTSWCPGIPIYLLYGTQRERYEALKNVYRTGGVILTSYDLVKSIIEDVKTVMQPKSTTKRKAKKSKRDGGAFEDDHEEDEQEKQVVEIGENHPWDVVIIDEAHRVKNSACKAARALRHLQARTRIMLSGTPLQNNLKELWALMDICMPGLLGNRATFESGFSEPIAAGSKRDASSYAVQLKDHLSRRLKLNIRPYFLRRTKDKVSEMRMIPPKTDIVMWLKFCPEQERFYKMILRSEVVNQARSHNGGTVGGIALFRSIRLLQKMCNHPLLSLKNSDYDKVLASWGNEVIQCTDDPDAVEAEIWDTTALKEIITDTAEKAAALSCKLRFLSVLLPALEKGGHRCLLFSQSTKMLNLVQGCVLRPLGLKFLRLDGTLHVEERNVKIAKFESPEGIQKFFCMCLSIQVGGVGLTLTSADRVVIIDPSWNPAVDMQAIDRTHRLGQTKPIVVYRLVGAGGIEDKMFRYQIFKRGVVKTLLEEENQTRYFTQKDMKDLFTYGERTQTLMQEKGYDLESEHVVNTIAQDVGEVNDNSAFWGSEDLEGFADYSDLFSTLEQATELDSEAQERAKEAIKKLREEQYIPETYEPIANTPAASSSNADNAECQLVAVDDQQPANSPSHQGSPAPKKRKAWSKAKQNN